MSRPTVGAVVLLLTGGVLPVAAVSAGWDWYLDSPALLLLAVLGGYAAGAWLPRPWAVAGILVAVLVLVGVNQAGDQGYHWLDDLVFFLVAVGGPAAAGAAVTTRAGQVRRLDALQAELDELHRIEVAAARLDEQNRILGEVHSGLAEQIAGIALRAEGARRAGDTTALAAIESEARSVLDRLRDALGSLRGADHPVAAEAGSEQPVPRWTPFDVVVPAVIGVALAVETLLIDAAEGPGWANVLAALVVVAPLVVRRHRPLMSAAGTVLAAVAMTAVLTPIPETVSGVGLLVFLFYSVGAWCGGWWWLAGWAIAATGAGVMELVAGPGSGEGDDAWVVLLWTVGAVAVGRVTAGWQARLQRTQAVVDELNQARGAAVRLAVAHEREALASELHDTVAHAMTVVCLQAGASQRVGNDVDEALQVIATEAERTLAELRDGLEAMEAADDPLDQSRIAALGRRVGVDLRVTADDAGSGPAAALAHRVIREAVVNVARHAPGATADVHVRRSGDDLAVEILDDGGRQPSVIEGTGSGLRGLAETLQAAGGRLEWGRREPAGFRVAAVIPGGRR
jgi:signal transduction histidine kinase